MNLPTTLLILCLSAGLFGWANWDSRREREVGEVSMVPHNLLQMLALIGVVVMAAHLFSLLTGSPLTGRLGY